MQVEDIRWQQRFTSFNKALQKLIEAVEFVKKEQGDKRTKDTRAEIIREGLIQRFENTHELAWKVMKDYLSEVERINTIGPKDTTRAALGSELIVEGETWMDMINSRNITSRTYNEETAEEIFNKIIGDYYQALIAFRSKIDD